MWQLAYPSLWILDRSDESLFVGSLILEIFSDSKSNGSQSFLFLG